MSTFQVRFNEAKDLVGGRYKLTALLQKRIRELVRGERPLVDLNSNDYVEIALAEVLEHKIEMGAELHDPEDTEILGGKKSTPDLDLDQDETIDQISIPL